MTDQPEQNTQPEQTPQTQTTTQTTDEVRGAQRAGLWKILVASLLLGAIGVALIAGLAGN